MLVPAHMRVLLLPGSSPIHCVCTACPAGLAYTGARRTSQQALWWRWLLLNMVHAATVASVVLRYTSTWRSLASSIFVGFNLGGNVSTIAWRTMLRAMPTSIDTWAKKHSEAGVFAGRLASCTASHCPLINAAALPPVRQHLNASSLAD